MSLSMPVGDRSTVSFADGLDAHDDRLAVVALGEEISYRQLAARVRETAASFGNSRKLVLVTAANHLDPLVAYLAALSAGHPVMLVPGDHPSHVDAIVATYDPDVVVSADGTTWKTTDRRTTSAHALHPDLALMLCTSGSTGSPKVVRLSHGNLDANANSISTYLDLRATDRALTSLPMHYCYGLSVINSHLLRGAGVILTDTSVVDPCFWDSFRSWRATSFAGVPYTFDLLDRIGFESMAVPGLRYVTQAGGRLAPDRVRRYAELGERDGWQLFVMYGQTEATARMAYLPPEKARTHPGAIGIPIPGGSFAIEPLDTAGPATDPDEGELVYRGPNVMLGYAERPADLAAGATIDALHTGDIARRAPDGLYEVIGRRSRFVKLFGLRIDLQRVEEVLDRHGVRATCTGDDDALILAVGHDVDAEHVSRLVREHVGLPPSRVLVAVFGELPSLSNGKPDYLTIRRVALGTAAPMAPVASHDRVARDVFAEILQRTDIADDATFVSLGGDSLSYVETSIRLERALGFLPDDWHTTPVRHLTHHGRAPRVVKRVETNIVLRAVAIVLVVGTHADVFHLPGGAHVLLAVAGFNFARFQLTSGHLARSVARIAVPSMCWITVIAATSDRFTAAHALLANGQFGPTGSAAAWRYWFVEALVQLLVVLAVLFAVPAVRRVERRHAFGCALAVLLVALAIRFDVIGIPEFHHRIYRPHEVLWLFAAGWAAARASSVPQKLAISTLIVPAVVGFFGQPPREALVVAGLVLLVWVPTVGLVWPINRLVGLVAGASLYIYLTHWQVYPPLLDRYSPLVATTVAVVAGVVASAVAQRLTTAVEARLSQVRAEGGLGMRHGCGGPVEVAGHQRMVSPASTTKPDVTIEEGTRTADGGPPPRASA